jgi:Uma2 family endonuclease
MPPISPPHVPVAVSLRLGPELRLSDGELFDLCAGNPELRLERTAEGDLIVMTPTGGESGHRSLEIAVALLDEPPQVAGDPELAGLVLALEPVWRPL